MGGPPEQRANRPQDAEPCSCQVDASRSARVLVVDDEAFVRETIGLYLLTEGLLVESVSSAEEALARMEVETYDLALVDIAMPGQSGLELLTQLKQTSIDTEVVMMSGGNHIGTAVQAVRMGAYDFIPKPILDFESDLVSVLSRALERRRLLRANRALTRQLGSDLASRHRGLSLQEQLPQLILAVACSQSLQQLVSALELGLEQLTPSLPRALILATEHQSQLVLDTGFLSTLPDAPVSACADLIEARSGSADASRWSLGPEALGALLAHLHPDGEASQDRVPARVCRLAHDGTTLAFFVAGMEPDSQPHRPEVCPSQLAASQAILVAETLAAAAIAPLRQFTSVGESA